MSMLIDGNLPAFPFPGGSQTINITMTGAAVSSALIPTSGVYRIITNGAVHVAKDTVPETPIATVNDMPIPANQPEYFGLEAGSTISAIGTLADIVSLTLMP